MTDKSQQRSGHLGKLQKHKLISILACGSVFSRLIGLFSCKTITFQKYFWCSRFSLFDCNSLPTIWPPRSTIWTPGTGYHSPDTDWNISGGVIALVGSLLTILPVFIIPLLMPFYHIGKVKRTRTIRGRNTLQCRGLTGLQPGEYGRVQKEQLWLNWTNRRTNLILTCLSPLDFFSDK